MAYSKVTFAPGDDATSAWANKVEDHIERTYNYKGVVYDYFDLPNVGDLDTGDWYMCSKDKSIYVNDGTSWVNSNEPLEKTTGDSLNEIEMPENTQTGSMDIVLKGTYFINLLGFDGYEVADSGSVDFQSVLDNIYFDSLNVEKITGTGAAITVNNASGNIANIAIIDLTEMGALDFIRSEKYGVSDWSDLTTEELAAEIPYFDGYMSANSDLYSVQDIQIVSEDGDGTHTDSIFLPTGIDLLSINSVSNEYNPKSGVFTRTVEKETVTVSTNAATSAKSGTGNCMLFDSDGIKYDGTISGTSVSVTAADGEYTLIYELSDTEIEYYYPQDLTCFENGKMYIYTNRKQDVGYYGTKITIEDAAKPIQSIIFCSKINLSTGFLIPIDTDNITIAEDGLSFTILNASSGSYYDYTYQYDTENRTPLTSFTVPINLKAAINSNRDTIQTMKYQTNTDRALLDSLNKTVNQVGAEDTQTDVVGIDNIEYYGYRQKPDIEAYGTTLVNLAGKSTGYTPYDFDSITRLNLDPSTGDELEAFGEAGYATDGSNGEVVVKFPKYYMHVGEIETAGEPIIYLEISETEADGFEINPAFVSGETILDHIYLGAFEGSVQKISDSSWIEDASDDSAPIQIAEGDLADHKLRSVSGRKPKSNQTLPEFRTMAQNNDMELVDIKQAGMVNLLYLMKYGDFNSQVQVGQGITGKAAGTNGNMAELTGATAALGAVDTGGTNLEAVSLFGLENWWGNIWEWTDGAGIKSDGFYVGNRPYNNTLDGYTKIPCSPLTTNGYLKEFYWTPDSKGLFLPKSIQTDSPSSSKYVCDYLYTPASYSTHCFLRGGGWNNSVNAGAFSWNLGTSFAARRRTIGARACYVPTV